MPIKHPDYPDIDFKPAIARYDYDQTYDILEFVYLPQGFSQLMNLCGVPAFELMAIDRFTPYRYRWAVQYSDVVYEFLKAFNFSPHNSINERLLKDESGKAILDENDNTITVPKFELSNTQVYDYAPILANFTEGKYQVTGLIYQGLQEGLIGSINTINQACAEFTVTGSKEIDLNKIIWNRWLSDDYELTITNSNRFCSNSLVISKLSNGHWIDYTPSFINKPTWLLYSDINNYFNNIKQQLIDYFDDIHSDFKEYLSKTISPLQNYVNYVREFSLEPNPLNPSILSINTEYSMEFEKFPAHYCNICFLQRANNNKWNKNINLLIDKGINPPIANNINLSWHLAYAEQNEYIYEEVYRDQGSRIDEFSYEFKPELAGANNSYPYGKYLIDYPDFSKIYDQFIPNFVSLFPSGGGIIGTAPYNGIDSNIASLNSRIDHFKYYIHTNNNGTWDSYYSGIYKFSGLPLEFNAHLALPDYAKKAILDINDYFQAVASNYLPEENKRWYADKYLYLFGKIEYGFYPEITFDISSKVGSSTYSISTWGGTAWNPESVETSIVKRLSNGTIEKYVHELWSSEDITQLINNNAMTDQEYLDYLLQLKQSMEAQQW